MAIAPHMKGQQTNDYWLILRLEEQINCDIKSFYLRNRLISRLELENGIGGRREEDRKFDLQSMSASNLKVSIETHRWLGQPGSKFKYNPRGPSNLQCNRRRIRAWISNQYLLCQPIDNYGEECVGGVELEEVHGVVEGVGRPVGVNGEEELGCNSTYH